MRARIRGGTRWYVALLGAALLVLGGAVPLHGAAPADEEPLSITFVARACDQYTQVMANKARNNLQESLRDLGPDTNYAPPEAVSAGKEQAGTPAPPCKPLPGWTFSTGTGITGRKPSTQDLSTVTRPMRQDITTKDSTPELDAQGNDTGRTLDGAVTVHLTASEQAAVRASRLWVQGGTPAQPLNGMQDQYGFAALRCAQDAVNGDNVETVSYPPGARHVFCYYYAITPPPGAGTIKVIKQVEPGSNGTGTFRFDGNISYADTNGDGVNDFSLTASAQKRDEMTFIRGESDVDANPWTFQEAAQPGSGWRPPSAARCTSADGTSRMRVDSTGRTAVGLSAGDTVTCVYTNSRTAGSALLQKESLGGTGSFDMRVDVPPGAAPIGDRTVTTQEEGVPVTVAQAPDAAAGTYTATERLPADDPTGTWRLTGATCDGEQVPYRQDGREASATYEVAPDSNPRCLLTNTFTPGGAINVEKVTHGGVGTFGFQVLPHEAAQARGVSSDEPAVQGEATTTEPGTPATAIPDGGSSGPLADHLKVSGDLRYTVQEQLPPATDAGRWETTGVACQGASSPLDRATNSVQVRLTPDNPRPTCRFTNRFVPTGTLVVHKSAPADTGLRPGAARLELRCADGTEDTLAVDPGDAHGRMPEHRFAADTSCTVTEPATGAADGTEASASAVRIVDGGPPHLVLLGVPFPVREGQAAVVRVTNRITAPAPTPTTPAPTPTTHTPTPVPPRPGPPGGPGNPGNPGAHGPHPGTKSGILPFTGLTAALLGSAAAALVGAGVLLRVMAIRRRNGG